MFKCASRDKEKPDSDEEYVPTIAKIGYLLFPIVFIKPFKSKVCKDCAPKIVLVGFGWLVVLAIILLNRL
jgi:hypothetical protein